DCWALRSLPEAMASPHGIAALAPGRYEAGRSHPDGTQRRAGHLHRESLAGEPALPHLRCQPDETPKGHNRQVSPSALHRSEGSITLLRPPPRRWRLAELVPV